MKVHELAKSLGFKSHDVLNKAKELGLKINAIASNLKDDEEEILRKAFENMTPPEPEPEKVDIEEIPDYLRKGALIGVVCDGNNFVLVSLKMTLEQVMRYEYDIISKHRTLPGAMIEMNKKVVKVINPNTVKQFNKEE